MSTTQHVRSNVAQRNQSGLWARQLQLCGLYGLIVVVLAMAISARGYHGVEGSEHYSPLNHFISELGNPDKNSLAFVLNSGLIIGGLLLAIAGRFLTQFSSAAQGIFTASMIGVAMVGVFPENSGAAIHLAAAVAIFCGTALAVGLFGFSIAKEDRSPLQFQSMVVSFAAVVCFFLMMSMPKSDLDYALEYSMSADRPDLLWLAVFEWAYFASMAVWVLVVTRFQLRRDPN